MFRRQRCTPCLRGRTGPAKSLDEIHSTACTQIEAAVDRGRVGVALRLVPTRSGIRPDRVSTADRAPSAFAIQQPGRGPGLDGALLVQSGRHAETTASGVMQSSAIGAGDDCCDRGRSRSSRALWRRAARQAAPGAHDGLPTGCDSRAHGVAVTAGGPEFGPPYDGRLLTDDRRLAASRSPTDATAAASRRP